MSFEQSSKSSRSSFGSEPQDDGDTSFGTNNYEAKVAASEKAAEASFGVDEVADLGLLFRDFVIREVPKAAVHALKVVRSSLTPGFVRRMKKTKIHIKHVAEAEKALDDLNVASSQNMVKELAHKKAEKEQDKIIREMLKARKHLREEVKAVIDDSNAKERDAEFQDFHRRHDLRLAEINAKIAREKKEAADAAEKEATDKRVWRINYYGQQARELKAESEERAITLAKEKQYQANLERTFGEFETRQFDRTVLQVGGIADGDDRIPLPGGNELGVFGNTSANPTGIKVNHNNNNRLDGDGAVLGEDEELFLEDVDQFDNHPTEFAAFTPYEEANIEAMDAETHLKQQQELYTALQAEINDLKMSIEQMYDVRQVLERDQTQMTQELLVIQRDQHGPPRRQAMTHEIQATDVWKRRTAQVNKRILDLQYSIDKAESRKSAADSQALTLAQTIAVLAEENKQKQAAAESFNGDMGQLPMVVGRSLSKVPGMGVTAKPKEFFDAVTHQSRLVGIREQSLEAAQIHRDRTAIDQGIWMERLKEEDVKQDLDSVVSRLVQIADRLQKSSVDTMRLNIIDSLKGFLASGLKLNPVRTKIVGLLPWYKHHDSKLSHHIRRYITNNAMGGLSFEIESDNPKQTADIDPSKEAFCNGVTLSDARTGYCVGTVELPKDTLWSVLVTISAQSSGRSKKASIFNPTLDENGMPEIQADPTDFISVKMGPTIASMSNQGTFFNKVNPLTGTILYDVRYVFRGKGFAFRFDFSSSSMHTEDHLAVCTGIYEEYEMKDLEVVNDPKIKSRQRVLSSFVKMLRINEQSGTMREVKLLEELIIIESNTKAKHWDSDIVSHVLQRYSKEYFLRILRAEILLQQEAGRVAWLERQKEKEASRGLMVGGDVEKELKLEASMKKYLMKKRAVQRRILDEGMDKVDKRIVLWDPSANVWRNLTILECKVRWVENGMVAHVTHMFQEYDEGHNKAGDPMELDLKNFKYFESPVQVIDAQSIARYKEKKAWDDAIRGIRERAKGQVMKLQEKFNKDKNREERIFRRVQRKATAKFESSIDVNAQKKLNAHDSREDLKKGFERALLDIRKGIITVDDLATAKEKKEIATQVSRERFVEKYKREKKEKFEEDMADKEEEMRDNVEELQQEFEIRRDNVNMQAEHDIEQIRKKIRAQLAKRKVHLMKKLKFDPEVFKKAVPQAANCEHLKTKAWGNNYGKGVKCMQCGKELEELYKEESQLLGHGSGSDPVLCEAVARHRRNEQAFRFRSSEELQAVERERFRLEKERREMEEDEKYFYDFNDLQAIYDFDHRHARSIKAAGIFRQGLQWTEDELEYFEETKIIREKVRLEKAGLPETLIKDFDPLSMIQEPPPTFRADDERRRAQYDQMLFSIGRLHNFSKRIHAFKMTRFELLSEREMFSIVLVALHKESYVFETQLAEIEADLDKTSKLMSTFKAMQELWLSANRIQAQATKDKLKAEMNRCGVWEAVNECHDITNIIKDETRTLLKSKLLMDAKLDNQVKAVQYRQTHYDSCITKFEANEKYLTSLKYCTPGSLVYTRYGQCYISYYRQTDDMVMVTLPFGRPPARAYIHYKEIIAFERAKQRAENLLMEQEDIAMNTMITAERIQCKKERYLMAKEEEGLRKYFEFLDLGKNETQTMLSSITGAVNERFEITESKIFNAMLRAQVNQTVNKERELRYALSKNYKGPPSGKPKPMGYFEAMTKRRDVSLEMKQAFIVKGATQAETHATRTLGETRSAWVLTYAFQQMIDSVIDGMIYEIADESYSEGRVAKGFAEKKSGYMIPEPAYMQYATYNSLATIWRARKDELKDRIERNRGESSKLLAADPEKPKKEIKTDPEEVKRIKEARRLMKLEKKRQETMCKEMQKEEILSRNFYRWELLENLRERRRMREEERLSLCMRKDEEKARLEAESAYSVSGGKGNALGATTGGKKDLSYDKRRQELKELTLERRRRVEDQAFMTLEDKAGQALRELDKLERQKKAYIAEFGEDEEDDDGMGMNLNQLDLMSSTKSVIPEWLTVPPEFKTWDVPKQNKFIKMMAMVRMKTLKIEKNVQKEFRKLEKLEAKSFKEWDNRFKVVEQAEMTSELELMEAEEEKREAEAKLIDLKENMMRVLIYCREKGEEELRSRSELKRLQEIARRRDRELEEATAWLNLCIKRAKNRDKLKRRVVTDCKWVDTDTINGFHQRFATERLREKLYYTYFRMIVASIINRAEVIATERNLMNLQEQLSFNKSKLMDRSNAMKHLLVDIRRDERMRMRRSFLNERFFPRSRRRVLEQRFGGWVRYYLWNRGHKEAFQLKYEVIKRQLDIDRQFKEQQKRDEAAKVAAEKAANQPFQTIMQKHRERVIQCKSCLKCYLESQNNSISCQYHPKQFIMECPRSCPNPGLTNLCAAHKKRRWTCCDAVRVDATGCSRRYHAPPDSDPVYDKIMEKINERDRDFLLALDEKWTDAMKQDWPSKANTAKRQQVFAMEDQLEKDRKTADRFKDLKFV